jgi:hypothetical protein
MSNWWRKRAFRATAVVIAVAAMLALTFGAGYALATFRSDSDEDPPSIAQEAPSATVPTATPPPAPTSTPQAQVAATSNAPIDEHASHAAPSPSSPVAPSAAGTTPAAPPAPPSAGVAPPANTTGCPPAGVPIGALPAQDPPVFCTIVNRGATTFVEHPNGWSDGFGHGLQHAELGAGYRVFDNLASVHETIHWRHNNHWMVDVRGFDDTPDDGPYNVGGTMMRPDRSFRFENGMLVVEAQVAAGIAAYGGAAWPELVVTTAPAPTFGRTDDLYSYDEFAGHDTLGCRLQSERAPICALFDNSVRGAGEGGRTWEISYFQSADAANVYGGAPFDDLGSAWRVCAGSDPDANCRDTFRWEITRDRLTIYVNGVKYMEHSGFPAQHQLPERFLNSDVYVYFSSWINKPSDAVRFHWGAITINPHAAP